MPFVAVNAPRSPFAVLSAAQGQPAMEHHKAAGDRELLVTAAVLRASPVPSAW